MEMSLLIILLIVLVLGIFGLIIFIAFIKRQPSSGEATLISRIGRYTVIRELPAGGMSRIFLCRRPDGGLVIIKIPVESRPQDDTIIKFLEEGDVLSRLSHPNIVGFEESGTIMLDGYRTCFVVLEYVQGTSLDQIIRNGRRFVPSEAALIISTIAEALSAIHAINIYHRDISPNNVIIDYDGNEVKDIKLIDFGIAKWREGSRLTTRDMMKEHYASPEQINKEPLDGRTDIFSLGVMFYEMLTGRRPFSSWERKTIPQTPSELGLQLPGNYEAVLMKKMEFDRDNRVSSAADVVRSLNVIPLGGKVYVASVDTVSAAAKTTLGAGTVKTTSGAGTVAIPAVQDISVAHSSSFGDFVRANARKILIAGAGLLSLAIVVAVAGSGLFTSTSKTVPVSTSPGNASTVVVPMETHSHPTVDARDSANSQNDPVLSAFCPYCGNKLSKKTSETLVYCPFDGKKLPDNFWADAANKSVVNSGQSSQKKDRSANNQNRQNRPRRQQSSEGNEPQEAMKVFNQMFKGFQGMVEKANQNR